MVSAEDDLGEIPRCINSAASSSDLLELVHDSMPLVPAQPANAASQAQDPVLVLLPLTFNVSIHQAQTHTRDLQVWQHVALCLDHQRQCTL